MATVREKVKSLLEKAFPKATLELQDDDGIIGVLVSDEFEELEAIDRQDKIWDVLDRALTPEEKRQVLTIVAATPEEHVGHTSTW